MGADAGLTPQEQQLVELVTRPESDDYYQAPDYKPHPAWDSLMARLDIPPDHAKYPHSDTKAAIADAEAHLSDPQKREAILRHALVQLETSCESGNQAVIDTDPAIMVALLRSYGKRWWRR